MGIKEVRDPSGPVSGQEPSKSTENVYGSWKRAPYERSGTETVEDWVCADDCPVKDIERQSLALGIHPAGNKGPMTKHMVGNVVYGGAIKPRQEDPDYYKDGHSGKGASRFFKQVEPDQPFKRSHHLAPCPECGKPAIDHPTDGRMPFLTVLCDGTRVKL